MTHWHKFTTHAIPSTTSSMWILSKTGLHFLSETMQWSNTDLKAQNVRCDILCDRYNFFLCIYCNEDSEFGFKSLSAKEL
jgi:hypothetical protein